MSFFKSKKEENKADVEPTVNEAIALPPGNDALAYHSVISVHISEKASLFGSLNKYEFKVAKNASKISVRDAIEKLYKVRVVKVNMITMPAKSRQVGRYKGTKSGFRKAIVTLKPGDKITIA